MNLTRVLNNALPEIPARVLSDRPPRKPPDMVSGEHIEDGQPIVRVVVANRDAMYRFPPLDWQLIQLFDGQRSYADIAEIISGQKGHEYSAPEIQEFADSMEAIDFWYKTPQEKNVNLMQKTAEERRKLLKSRKSKFGDLAEIVFPAINPDKFVTWLYGLSKFIYTGWFSLITLVAFSITAAISIVHWDEIGRDTVEFFAFSNMSGGDLVVFYILALLTMCWHELAHAHACKHYGGRVPAMGFALVYLTPAFYTDTSEGFVKGNRYQRFIIAMAGAFSELYICAVATPIWWGTTPGSRLHTAAYLLMLMSGIAGLFINWNPLMKLDGYYMLSEALGIADLKENSTAYVSAWIKRHIWRLPVEVPYVPRRRRLGFAIYALLSGAYSYTVLYIVARFVGNVFRSFNPEWSFIPELGTAALIFRSRIRTLVNFMKFVYLDKKDRIRAWMLSQRGIAVLASGILFLFVPLWRESTEARFVLEPERLVTVRNLVPGTITQVYAREGMTIAKGSPLFSLRNGPLESRTDGSKTDYRVAAIRVNEAASGYRNLGLALAERQQLELQSRDLRNQSESLQVDSPISGTVLTPRVGERLGGYVPAGTGLVEIADLHRMRAYVYVSEHDMYKLRVGAPARLKVDNISKVWSAQALSVTPVASGISPAITERAKFKGLSSLNFYIVSLFIENTGGGLKPGMIGTAKIYGKRESLVGSFGREVVRFFGRKAW